MPFQSIRSLIYSKIRCQGSIPMKFSSKITLFFSILVVSTVAIVSYLIYSSASDKLRDSTLDRLNEQAYHTLAKMDELFHGALEDTQLLSKSIAYNLAHKDGYAEGHAHGLARVKDKLTDFKSTDRYYDSVALYDMDRVKLVDSDGLEAGVRHVRSNYWIAIEAGEDLVMDMSESESPGKSVFHFVSVVKDAKGRRVGVVVVRADSGVLLDAIVRDFWGVVKYSGEGATDVKNMDVELVDSKGSVVYSMYHGNGARYGVNPYWGMVAPMIEKGARHGNFTVDLNSSDRLTAGVFVMEPGFNDFKGNNWTLVASVPESEVLAPIYKLRNTILLIAFLGCLLGGILVYATVVYLIRPLKKLNVAVASIGHGSLNEAVPVESRDEVGTLTEAFNRMAKELKEKMEEKERYATELHEMNYVLQKSLKEVKILKGLLPICSSCKKIRNENGEWNSVERYISTRTDAQFTHGICPECAFKLANEDDYKN